VLKLTTAPPQWPSGLRRFCSDIDVNSISFSIYIYREYPRYCLKASMFLLCILCSHCASHVLTIARASITTKLDQFPTPRGHDVNVIFALTGQGRQVLGADRWLLSFHRALSNERPNEYQTQWVIWFMKPVVVYHNCGHCLFDERPRRLEPRGGGRNLISSYSSIILSWRKKGEGASRMCYRHGKFGNLFLGIGNDNVGDTTLKVVVFVCTKICITGTRLLCATLVNKINF
jgi:hypothetical protein